MHLSDDRLSAYLDGELTPDEAAATAAHLGGCATCAGSLRLFSGLDKAISAAPALSCAAVAPLISAQADAQLGPEEAGIVSAHLETCADCRGDVRLWTSLDQTVAAMPAGKPSRRVDAAIAALGRTPVRRAPRIGMAWSVPTLAVVTAITLVLVLSVPSAAPLVGTNEPGVIVAAAQEQILDATTNTLYTLDPNSNTVTATDATTRESKGLIRLGGKPTALVMNYAKNTLVVWDASNKTFVELTPDLASVTSTTTVDVPGTVTSVQADARGNLVVGAVVGGSGPAASASAQAVIATVDGGTGQVQTVRQIDVAPRIIVIQPNAPRVLLVSLKSTVLADAATYTPLATTVGGVGAAFAVGRDDFAVLSDSANGALVTFARGSSVTIGGTPHAITGMPGGGFAILADRAGVGVITVINADGIVSTTLTTQAGARDLAYDAEARKFAVVSPTDGVASVALPDVVAQKPPVVNQGSPLPTAQTTPIPTPTAAPTATAAPVVVAPRENDDLVPTGARPLFAGTYFLSMSASQRPSRTVGDGTRIWYLDGLNRVNVLHLDTGELNQVSSVPPSATVTDVAMSSSHVYFLDRTNKVLYALNKSIEQVTSINVPFAASVSGLAGSPDGRLWMSTTIVGLASYDPRTSHLETVADAGPDLSAVATDSLGRVWFAGKQRQAVDVYDPLAAKITERVLPHTGAVTALIVDRADAVWIGTDTGQALAIRVPSSGASSLIASAAVGRPISSFSLDQNGALYFVSRDANAVVFGGVRVPAIVQQAPASATEPMFDSFGRVWQADRLAGGFYVTLPGARP